MSEEGKFDKWLISNMPGDVDYVVHTEAPLFMCKFGPFLESKGGFNSLWKEQSEDIFYDIRIYGNPEEFWLKHEELLAEAQSAILDYYNSLSYP